MKRSTVCAMLALVLAAGLLFQASDGSSRPVSALQEPRNPAVPHPVLRDDEPHQHRRRDHAGKTGTRPASLEAEGVEGRAVGADDGAAPSATASVRGDELHHRDDAHETGTRPAGVEVEDAERRAAGEDGGAVPSATASVRSDEPHHQHHRDNDETGLRPAGVEVEGAERRAAREDGGAAPSATASVLGDEPHHQHHRDDAHETGTRTAGVEVEGAERRAARGDCGAAPSATASARVEDQGGVVRPRHWSASSSRSPLLLRSKLARRFLAVAPPVEGAADSAARSSCQSRDVHIGCSPP